MNEPRQSIGDSLYKWFYLIDEPRIKRLLYTIIYLLFIAMGVVVIARHDSPLAQSVGFAGILALALALIIGGAIGVVAVWPGLWWLEKVAFIPLAGAILIRAAILTESGITPAAAIFYVIGTLLLVARLMDIWKYDGPELKTSPTPSPVT